MSNLTALCHPRKKKTSPGPQAAQWTDLVRESVGSEATSSKSTCINSQFQYPQLLSNTSCRVQKAEFQTRYFQPCRVLAISDFRTRNLSGWSFEKKKKTE